MKTVLIALSTLCLVAACTSRPDTVSTPGTAAKPAGISAVPEEGLPPQRLLPGQCGLFLWGMSAPRKFVFFTEGTAGEALILVNDEPASMPMTVAGGEVFGQFLTEMTFADARSGGSVSVSIKPGEALEGGQRVESGNLLYRNADGWETILPVTGVRACMPG